MRFLHSLLVFSFLFSPALAQEPADAPAETDSEASVFDSMMETLFGKSSLPEPQGTLRGSTTDPAPLFSETPPPEMQDAPDAYDVMQMPDAPMDLPVVMDMPLPLPPVAVPVPAAPRRNRVAGFDIAGIKLKMMPKEVFREALRHDYELSYMDKESANFVKWRLERECMDAGVFIYERKQECIIENARKSGDYYVNYMEFVKEDSKEKIRAFFTSSFSGNRLYRVTYYNEGDNSLGGTIASSYIKDKRRTEFYNWVMRKYGNPDNPQTMVWGEGGDSPYFQAFITGNSINFHLILENPLMPYEDSRAMQSADIKGVTYSKFSF